MSRKKYLLLLQSLAALEGAYVRGTLDATLCLTCYTYCSLLLLQQTFKATLLQFMVMEVWTVTRQPVPNVDLPGPLWVGPFVPLPRLAQLCSHLRAGPNDFPLASPQAHSALEEHQGGQHPAPSAGDGKERFHPPAKRGGENRGAASRDRSLGASRQLPTLPNGSSATEGNQEEMQRLPRSLSVIRSVVQ